VRKMSAAATMRVEWVDIMDLCVGLVS